MRWVLAGLAFAALVELAVATAATRAGSVKIRGRLERLEHAWRVQAVEHAALVHRSRTLLTRAELRRLWLRWAKPPEAS